MLAAALACAAPGAEAQTTPPPATRSQTPPQNRPRPSILIPRVSAPPNLEDYLLPTGPGPGVATGVHVDGFLQREPGDLVPASERTDAYISYDATNIYVVFVCRASDPSTIRARMSKRESIFSDDFVALLLDTFDDKQRAYMFFSTPLGIQADGITTEGQDDDMSFDTVWHSRGRLTDFGYVVSITVPFRSLRFPFGATGRAWGLSLMRGIPVKNEQVFWPGITRSLNGFTSQFADASGIDGVSPGRNIQLIPYGTFTGASFLDGAVFDDKADGRAGLDTKVVLKDALTVDLTLNPDFSQVESDEPQVTINQRFEVFFPEKRPFFLENAGYFQTPINLFFSRRIGDPQFGARATGKLGGWAAGALVIDDRAPGHRVEDDDPLFDNRAGNAVVRARREFGQNSIGAFITDREFGPSFNRVASADTRLKINSRIFFDGQAVTSDSRSTDGESSTGNAWSAAVNRSGRKLSYSVNYLDVGPGFQSALGFVPRTDIRQATEFVALRWRPKLRGIQSLGPNSFVQATWDHAGVLQDWTVRYPFFIEMKAQSGLFVRHTESMERFQDIEFREHEDLVNFFTSRLKWMDFQMYYAAGTRPNYYPAEGLLPFLADFRDGNVTFTFRPLSGLLLDETYIYSHLGVRPETGSNATIFDNHIVRSRVNYQFSRELSLRAILDYNGVLANTSLVALDRTKHLAGDVLLTYLVNPGTAFYVGYNNGYDNVAVEDGVVHPIPNPTTATGRQFFVKASYLFRF
jgi:hypothetical protein